VIAAALNAVADVASRVGGAATAVQQAAAGGRKLLARAESGPRA
jgi:hypothetical protein